MLLDKDTNKVYLSSLLALKNHNMVEAMTFHLDECSIPYEFVDGTKDIWMRDYMPIQIDNNKFIGYNYDPDYLKYPKYYLSKSNGNEIAKNLGMTIDYCNLIIDGGNVIKTPKHIIMTEKVFFENKHINRVKLIELLEFYFKSEILFLPWDKVEMYGHADGIVRYIDNDLLLMTNYHDYSLKLLIDFIQF